MNRQYRFLLLTIPLAIFLFVAFAVVYKQSGVVYETEQRDDIFLPEGFVQLTAQAGGADRPPACLILTDGAQDVSPLAQEVMEAALQGMRVPYELVDLQSASIPSLDRYQTVVITFANLDILWEDIFALFQWVEHGGGLMFMSSLEITPTFQATKHLLGVSEGATAYMTVSRFRFDEEFMIGAKDKSFAIEEPFQSALDYNLLGDCHVYMYTDDRDQIPLLWKRDYGLGRIVVHNHNLIQKYTRGVFAASYSLLHEAFVYPVINASTFFIDDFPAPVPSGQSEYIQRDYQRDISGFYTNVWWPDMLRVAQKYDIPYTGLIIEQYSDDVKQPFPRNEDAERYAFFGNMLLDEQGELGLHGYNHIPMGLDEYDTEEWYPSYSVWASYGDMLAAMKELEDFSQSVFPDTRFRTYVPPSNILRPEAMDMLKQEFPDIKVFASLYLPGYAILEQEFDVDERDGTINFPRVTSGYSPDEFMEISAVSELNFHYVNSHFIHPDDVLDEDRGASRGWAALLGDYEAFIDWIYAAAPNIRTLTSLQGAAAIERYHYSDIRSQSIRERVLTIELEGVYDEVYCMLRLDGRTPKNISGGELERLTDLIYIVRATSPLVSITFEE